MILKIWLKLFLIVLLVLVPITAAQFWMERESIELVFNLAQKSGGTTLLDDHMADLKKLSQLEPVHSEQYHQEFEKVNAARNFVGDIQLLRHGLVNDLAMQTLRNLLLVALFALGVTYLIARSIVAMLRRLVLENERQSLRLERMGALESWQRVARMMVHEMRAPVTPIKLIATDMGAKYNSLTPDAFRNYLERGAGLIKDQIVAIERLTDSLTEFAKLPEVQKKPGSLRQFLQQFADTYRAYGNDRVRMVCEEKTDDLAVVEYDPTLLNLLFFNLLKNAHEANPERDILVRLSRRSDGERTWISVANSGAAIPDDVATQMFNLNVTSKNGANNFGVGLAVARKIALDHHGDLYLSKNNRDDGVVFELELPNT